MEKTTHELFLELEEHLKKEKERAEKEKERAEKEKEKAEEYKEEVKKLNEEKKIEIEKKVEAEKNAKLAEDFKKQNYSPLIKELFEEPTRKMNKQALLLFITSVCISIIASLSISSYFDNINSELLEENFNVIDNNINSIEKSITNTSNILKNTESKLKNTVTQTNDKVTSALENTFHNETSKLVEKLENTFDQKINKLQNKISGIHKDISESNSILKEEVKKHKQIKEGTLTLINYLKSNKDIKNYFSDYKTNKNTFYRLYYTRLLGKATYYESYIEAFSTFNISSDYIPKSTFDMLKLDRIYLNLLFSASTITKFKSIKKWSLREEDKYLNTYINNEKEKVFENWGFLKRESTSELYNSFKMELDKIILHIQRNNKIDLMMFPPNEIFYTSYENKDKNIQIYKLLDLENELKDKINFPNKLTVKTHKLKLDFKESLIKKVQYKLYFDDFISSYTDIDGILGNKTIDAIKKYEETNNLPKTGKITISLLNELEIPLSPLDINY